MINVYPKLSVNLVLCWINLYSGCRDENFYYDYVLVHGWRYKMYPILLRKQGEITLLNISTDKENNSEICAKHQLS